MGLRRTISELKSGENQRDVEVIVKLQNRNQEHRLYVSVEDGTGRIFLDIEDAADKNEVMESGRVLENNIRIQNFKSIRDDGNELLVVCDKYTQFDIIQDSLLDNGLIPPVNFSWVLPGKIAGSGQVKTENEKFLQSEGVSSLLNISSLSNPEFMNCKRINLAEHSAPTVEQFKEGVEFIENADKVLVYCKHGRDRTGIFLTAYLMYCVSKDFKNNCKVLPIYSRKSYGTKNEENSLPHDLEKAMENFDREMWNVKNIIDIIRSIRRKSISGPGRSRQEAALENYWHSLVRR